MQNKKQVIGGFVLAKHKAISTKLEIVKTATRLIWEKGYTAMSTRTVAAELDISVGNITYYYPSKDDLLSILVSSLCKFQRKLIEDEAESKDILIDFEKAYPKVANESNVNDILKTLKEKRNK